MISNGSDLEQLLCKAFSFQFKLKRLCDGFDTRDQGGILSTETVVKTFENK